MAIFASTKGLDQGTLFTCSRSKNGDGWTSKTVSVIAENGGLKVLTPYNSQFVNELKMFIPATARKWEPNSKAWLVSRDHADTLKQIIDKCYGTDVAMPTVIAPADKIFTITFQADYVANCKNEAASVHCNGGWNAKIPEKVLRAWFKQSDAASPATLYGLLGVETAASAEEIKKAYKRAARQWHPDVCREENAREMFEKVKEAYELLSDPLTRNKYNAGLMFEQMAKQNRGQHHYQSKYSSFTPMLRCGKLTVNAKRELGVLVVEEILAWDDIENETGQIMVSFWAVDTFGVAWV